MPFRVAVVAVAVCLLAGQGSDSIDQCRAGIHDKVNALRGKEGLPPLVRNDQLEAAAQKHAENMAKQDKMSHELDGKRSKERVLMEGYPAIVVAENIAQAPAPSAKTAAAVVESWRYSPGHYRNILLEAAVETGVGVAKGKSGKWYYCQVFAAPKKK